MKPLYLALVLLMVGAGGFLAYDYFTQSGFIFPLSYQLNECAWLWVPQGYDDPDGVPGPVGGDWYDDPIYWGPGGQNYYSFDERILDYCSGDTFMRTKTCSGSGLPADYNGETSDPWKYVQVNGQWFWVYTKGTSLRWDSIDCNLDCATVTQPAYLDPRDDVKFALKGCAEGECEDDGDCENDEICDQGYCEQVECKTDADCDTGETCEDYECEGGGTPAVCGNGVCESGESIISCPADCALAEYCGDGICNGPETCSDCPEDCGSCPSTCGNGACDADETCTNCPTDCGACPTYTCGNDICETSLGENQYVCPQDCAPPIVGDEDWTMYIIIAVIVLLLIGAAGMFLTKPK